MKQLKKSEKAALYQVIRIATQNSFSSFVWIYLPQMQAFELIEYYLF